MNSSSDPQARPTGNRPVIDDAAVQLIAEQGLEAATVRRVASRARVSPGLVQHHYPTKQAMLLAAMATVEAAVQQRLRALDQNDPASVQLQNLTRQVLPLDATRAAEARVWLAFTARAAVDPVIAAAHASSWQQLEDAIAQLLAAHAGDDRPNQLLRDRAALLLAGLDGLAATAVSEPRRLPIARIKILGDRMLKQALGSLAHDGQHGS